MPLCRYSGHKFVTNQFLVSRGKLFNHQAALITNIASKLVQDNHCGSTDFKSVSRQLTSLYYAVSSSIYRRFSRQSKLRPAWYQYVIPSSSGGIAHERSFRVSHYYCKLEHIRAQTAGCERPNNY